MKKKKMLRQTAVNIPPTILVLVLAFIFVFPMIWMVATSLKNQSAAISLPPEIFVRNPTLDNYDYVLSKTKILLWVWNSISVSALSAGLILIIAATASYALTRIPFSGRNIWFGLIVVSMMIPTQLTLVPLFKMMRQLNLTNTPWAVILPSLACMSAVFLMKQLGQSIPSELFQAARIDGCSELAIFFRIYLPLVKPAIAALTITTFTTTWNNYLWQLVMLTSSTSMTLPVGIRMLSEEYVAEYGHMMAAATIGMLPTLLIFIIFQKYFVKGITLGGVKG